MIIQEINNQNIDFAISPFGPLIVKGHIDDDEKDKLLEITNNSLLTDDSDQIIRIGPETNTDERTIQSESVKKGKVKVINNDFVNQTILKIVDSYLNVMCSNNKHEVKNIYEITSAKKIQISSVWCVLMKDGDYHVPHDHFTGNVVISGGIYLNVPKDNIFPNGCINWHLPMPGIHLRKNIHTVLPKTNDFYIWPAWLQHSVNTLRSEHDRKMISFNSSFTSCQQGFLDKLEKMEERMNNMSNLIKEY